MKTTPQTQEEIAAYKNGSLEKNLWNLSKLKAELMFREDDYFQKKAQDIIRKHLK